MSPILDSFLQRSSNFTPKTAAELFALRLAQKLNDALAASHYAELAGQHSEAALLAAFRQTLRSRPQQDLGRRFHVELQRGHGNGCSDRTMSLIAIRVERRSIAAAIFIGDRLSYTQVRQLSSNRDKSLGSAAGFVDWLLRQFRPDSAALESIPTADEIHRLALHKVVAHTLRERLLPIWVVAKQDLFLAYGHPPLKSRKQVRLVVAGIWPVLAGANGQNFIQDAAALGLYVQVERLFLH